MSWEARFALSTSVLLSSCLHSRQRVREKIERDKAERAKKVGDWEDIEGNEVHGLVKESPFLASEGKMAIRCSW